MTLNVVLFTANWDTGAQGWNIKSAFDRYQPEFKVRSIHTDETYFKYPTDLPYQPRTAYPLFAEADVVHMRNGLEGLPRLLGERDPAKAPPGIVLHFHGTRFREQHAVLAQKGRDAGAVMLASTLDLARLEPDVAWLPAPVDISLIASCRPIQRADGPIRIAHAPTNRTVKSTLRIMDAVSNLHKAGYGIVFDLIERVPHQECLRRKGLADIVIDQLDLGIGNNSLEAFAMGIPVIAGVADPSVRETMISHWGSLPFFEADQGNLEMRLALLIRNHELRTLVGSNGYQYVVRYHEQSKVAQQLAEIYRTAASTTSGQLEGVI